RHGADEPVAQVQADLEGQLPGSLGQVDRGRQCIVDLWHGVERELDVDNRADDSRNAAECGALCRRGFRCSGSHGLFLSALAGQSPAADAARASAPPTISVSSWVISAWRAVLANRV